ncbi:MAG: magnesium/cobalt transporter CorA [Anaerolineales bacterium]|nr:magnesium/cobalt transporter CorA [Anaerolineales bacterium]
MLRTMYLPAQGALRTGLEPIDIAFALQDPYGLFWVDFEGMAPEECQPMLLNTFGFHPLAVDDALEESHFPKLDDWGKYLYIVLHTPRSTPENRLETLELDIFLGDNFIVTHHDAPIEAVQKVWSSIERDPRYLRGGPDHVLYRLADETASATMLAVELLDDETDAIEAEVFERPKPILVERIFAIKRSMLHLRRIIAPQREVLNKLARDEFQMIDEKDRIYFRDVYDHYVRLYEIIESVRDLVSGTLDTYLSVTNNRMNDIMKTLTLITTFFMPISFVAGFFGMNFFATPDPLTEWMTRPMFVLAGVLMVAMPAAMYIWMRRMGWMQG